MIRIIIAHTNKAYLWYHVTLETNEDQQNIIELHYKQLKQETAKAMPINGTYLCSNMLKTLKYSNQFSNWQ